MNKKLYLLDAYALIYRGYYALIRSTRPNSKGQDTSAIFGFLNIFEDILNRAGTDSYVAVVFDPPGPTFRHEQFPEYKAQREKTPEPISFAIPYIKKIIAAQGVKMYQVEGYEADDVIGTLAHQATQLHPQLQAYMITPDKDYGQLVTERIHILKPEQRGGGFTELGPAEVAQLHGIKHPTQVIDLLALWGDASDNVPGCPGIGAGKASALLQEYQSIEDIYAHIDSVKGAKMKENLIEYREQVLLSRQLVTIHTNAPVSFELEEMKRGELDKATLTELYEELEFRSRLRKLKEGEEYGLFAQQAPESAPSSATSSYATFKETEKQYHLLRTPLEVSALVNRLEKAPFFAFDTETDALGALTCGIVGISFALQPNEVFYLPLSELPTEATQQLAPFRALFANPNILKVGQNLKFDLEVISRYGIEPQGPYWDTMIAHYLINPEQRHGMDALSEAYLGYRPIPIEELIGAKGKKQKTMREVAVEEVSRYACEDADVTLQLYLALKKELEQEGLEALFYQMEMPLMEVLMKMEQTGVRIDTKQILSATKALKEELAELEQAIYKSVGGYQFNINSPREVGVLLFEVLQLEDKPKKTKTGQYSTNEETLQKLASRHPVVPMILEQRGLKKLISTYVEPLPTLVNRHTGRIHTNYNQTVTATGRLSSTDPNLQNIPIRDQRGQKIRAAFTSLHPEEGHLFLSADYSQVELRIMAHFAEDQHLIEAFLNGADIHTATAAKIYHLAPEEVTPELRSRAKTANFGIIYGISAFGLSTRLGIPRSEANQLIEGYFMAYPGVLQYMERVKQEAKEKGYVTTLMGRRRFLPDINSRNATVRGFAERNAINMPIQGTAADIIKLAMVAIEQSLQAQGLQSKMILQVHDELNFSVPPHELEIVAALVKEKMEGILPSLRVPLVVDVGWGYTWLEAH